ncbi:hypothetical protein F383_00874 [Gossypium arboreum]|uniref:Uncharacterized protein n=1 Tax=Gossypium arboreum TaxID=29729 RepID=A0A0B0NU61_GOSAR|nr:hypothetical protein F383_00874 [Gossypium arboreum]
MLTLELPTGLLTQADSHDEATRCCSYKLTRIRSTCRITQPPVGHTDQTYGPVPNHITPNDMSFVS